MRPLIVPAAEWPITIDGSDLLQRADDAGLDATGDGTFRHQRGEPMLVAFLVERGIESPLQ